VVVGATTLSGLIAILPAVFLSVGSGGGTPRPTGGVAGAVARASPTASVASSPAPASSAGSARGSSLGSSPTARPSPPVRVVEQAIVPWTDANGATQAEVVVAIRNETSNPIRVEGGSSRYDVIDRNGLVVGNGYFPYAFPEIIRSGGSAYLIARVGGLFVQPRDLATLRVTLDAHPQSEPALNVMANVSDMQWRRSPDGGIEVSGTVTNSGPNPVLDGVVCVVLRDVSNRVLGAVYDPATIGTLLPNMQASFTAAFPGTAPIDPKAIHKTEAIAFDISG
jgi:hypothetical protein